jgi:hypothetical protein
MNTTVIVKLVLAVLAALLGVVVLFRGRRLPWLFSGAAAFLLGVLLVRILNEILGNPTEDAEGLSWADLIPAGAALLGVLAGRYRLSVAYGLIGLCTGGALALWVARMVVPVGVALDFWTAVVAILVMALGLLFVLRYGEVALIVLSAGVGVSLIAHGLVLPADSQLVAALGLAAAIAGLVVQYHDYLVDLRSVHRQATGVIETPEPAVGEAGG